MTTMSKAKKPEPEPKDTGGTVSTIRLPPKLSKRLAYFIGTQRVEPDKTAVILKAIKEFLDRENIPDNPPDLPAAE